MSFLTLKSLHVILMVTWFAGLFYLPRLYVYHAMLDDDAKGNERFKIMERKLFWGIMTPGGIFTVITGLAMVIIYHDIGVWLHIKLTLVALLIIYHVWCGKLLNDFKYDKNQHSHVWYRWFNEFPVLIIIPVVFLVIYKPF
ncbi:MAG: protoporphyrinogen oxidase HemJ [Betaproteobacteria bacterium]|nr:protoporphyrinogen oxidase HemJ [Betaproteobacteria bacterium]MDE2423068.1 protoporphyrinogen oxidase HemJ [Betaproteobacteria bacterium]